MHEEAGEHQILQIGQPVAQLFNTGLLRHSYLAPPEEVCWQHAPGSNIQDICARQILWLVLSPLLCLT